MQTQTTLIYVQYKYKGNNKIIHSWTFKGVHDKDVRKCPTTGSDRSERRLKGNFRGGFDFFFGLE
jgi:hypothetical protein